MFLLVLDSKLFLAPLEEPKVALAYPIQFRMATDSYAESA